MWCVRSERVRGEINIRERVKGGPISQVNHRREKRRGEGGAGYWSDNLRYLCLTERRAVEWRRVGEEGVRLLAVGKREVRGALGGGGGEGRNKRRNKGLWGERISHDIICEMKSWPGLRPGLVGQEETRGEGMGEERNRVSSIRMGWGWLHHVCTEGPHGDQTSLVVWRRGCAVNVYEKGGPY